MVGCVNDSNLQSIPLYLCSLILAQQWLMDEKLESIEQQNHGHI